MNCNLYNKVFKELGEKYNKDHVFFQSNEFTVYEDIIETLNNLSSWGFICLVLDVERNDLLEKINCNEDIISFNIIEDSDFISVSFIFKGYNKMASSSVIVSSLEDLMLFINKRKLRPDKISFVSFGGGRLQESHTALIEESRNSYEVDSWNRNDIFTGAYASFSQIMNEGINSSKNEFIIFLHQNCTVDFKIMEKLIVLLCSGYAFASEINFGFFACTKQLFRKIGLLDERFIGGENEDIDWFFRMKMADVAFYENGNNEICPGHVKPWGSTRGLSRTIFEDKWIRKDGSTGINFFINNWYISNFYKDEKKFIDNTYNYNIENSWLPSSMYKGKEWISSLAGRCNISICPFEEKYINSNGLICLNIIEGHINIKFLCNDDTFIYFTIQKIDGSVIRTFCIRNNWFSDDNIEGFLLDNEYELRINHGEDRIYHDRCFKLPYSINLNVGLRIKKIFR